MSVLEHLQVATFILSFLVIPIFIWARAMDIEISKLNVKLNSIEENLCAIVKYCHDVDCPYKK